MSDPRDDEDEETTSQDQGSDQDDQGESDDASGSSDASDASDDDGSDAGDDAPAPAAAPAPAPASSPVGPPTSAMNMDAMKAYLAKQFGQAADNSGVEKAKADASSTNMVANIGQALEGLARSNSMAHGGAGVNQGFYQSLRQQGQLGVQQAQQQREQAIRDFVTKQQLGQQAVKSTLDEQLAQKQLDQSDPTSKPSQIAQAVARSMKLGIPDDTLKDLSANQLGQLAQISDAQARLKSAEAMHEQAAAFKENSFAAAQANRQNQAYSEMVTKMQTPRGNTEVQTAQAGQGSIQKALGLINQYPDPNQMPSQQANILNEEITKIATGGVPSEFSQKGTEANTLAQRWADFQSKVGNNPTPAQLGGFIRQNKQYLQDMQAINQGIINKFKRDIYDGYRGRLRPEDDMAFRAGNKDLFPEDQNAPLPAGGQPSPAAAPGGQGPQTAAGTGPAPASGPTLQDVEAEIARRQSLKRASK